MADALFPVFDFPGLGDTDTARPVPAITGAAGVWTGAQTVTLTFTNGPGGAAEAVVGFVVGDITVTNATLSAFTLVSPGVYTVVASPVASGPVTLSVAAGVCTDLSGNLSEASNVLSRYAVLWLLLDRFTTAREAGAVNGTAAEPGPGGNRTVVDTGGKATITDGEFRISAATAVRNPWLYYASGIAKAVGRTVFFKQYDSGYSNHWAAGFAETIDAPSYLAVLGTDFLASFQLNATGRNGRVWNYSAATFFDVAVILRSAAGYFLMIDGRLAYINRTTTLPATLYPAAFIYDADASCDLRLDNMRVADVSTTVNTLYPTPVVSDTFSDTSAPLLSNGLADDGGGVNGAGKTWSSAATISNSGNKAYISPTPGAELLANPGFTSWTGDNPDGWTLTGESGTDPEVSEVGTGEGHGGAGTGKGNLYSSATANRPYISQSVATPADFFRGTLVVDRVISGTCRLVNSTTGIDFCPTANSAGTFTGTERYAGTGLVVVYPGAAPVDFTLASVSFKVLPFAQTLRAVPGTAEPFVSVKTTIVANTQAGVVINLDDETTPQNCIHVWYNRTDGKIYARELVAGTWSADKFTAVTATYAAGGYLEVRRVVNEIYVWYNGAFIGSWTSATSTANTKVALFATDPASYFEALTVYPTGGYDYAAYA